MRTASHANETVKQIQQGNIRAADLRRWMYLNNVTFKDLGRIMGGISREAAIMSLRGERMPVRHHRAITKAYPDLPVQFLPEPRDIPMGPRPKGLKSQEAAT